MVTFNMSDDAEKVDEIHFIPAPSKKRLSPDIQLAISFVIITLLSAAVVFAKIGIYDYWYLPAQNDGPSPLETSTFQPLPMQKLSSIMYTGNGYIREGLGRWLYGELVLETKSPTEN